MTLTITLYCLFSLSRRLKNNNRNHFASGVKIQRVETRLKRKHFLQGFFFVGRVFLRNALSTANLKNSLPTLMFAKLVKTRALLTQTCTFLLFSGFVLRFLCWLITVCKKFLFCLSSTALRNIFSSTPIKMFS